MSQETSWAREAVIRTLNEVPFLQPWAFEFTPASSQGAVDSYMDKVRDCDVFLWLVGETTTPPVEREIREALKHQKRFWVFRLPSNSPSQQTLDLLDLVGARAKWVSLHGKEELQDQVQLTLQDEIVRALKLQPTLGRASRLANLDRESRSRCVAGWQAVGVPREEAQLLALDASVGRPNMELLPSDAHPLITLVGDFGAGKSLWAERFHQLTIERALVDPDAPVPVWLSGDMVGHLREDVIAGATNIGDPERSGTVVVIDHLDEVGTGRTARLVSEARVLVNTWPKSMLLLTSRSASISNPEERSVMPTLTEAEALSLVNRFSGTGVNSLHALKWPESIRDAIRRPLFALLLAKSIGELHSFSARTPAELIAFLVQHSLGPAQVDTLASNKVLMEAARSIIDSEGRSLDSRELGRGPGIRNALDTGLIVEEDGRIRFSLPIILEWFAALSLAAEEPSSDNLARHPERLEAWRYPLGVLIASNDHTTVLKTLGPIAKANPAFASIVIQDAVGGFQLGDRDMSALPSPEECGARVRSCMEQWVAGLGPLATELRAVSPRGDLRPLGVRVSGGVLATSWFGGDMERDPVSHLPSQSPTELFGQGWLNWMSAVPPATPAWAWHWTKDEISREMQGWLRDRSLSLDSGPVALEEAWRSALALSGRGSLNDVPIPISHLEPKLNLYQDAEVVHTRKGSVLVGPLRRKLTELRILGETELSSPWPPSNVAQPESSWVWSLYTEDQFLERTRAIYGAALQAYEQIVNRYLKNFAQRLALAVLLPVRLVGSISHFDDESGLGPVLEWYLEPLPAGEDNEIEISFGSETTSRLVLDTAFRSQLNHTLAAARPSASKWMSIEVHAEVLEVFGPTPATDLAHSWIWRDLHEVGWISSPLFPSRRR